MKNIHNASRATAAPVKVLCRFNAANIPTHFTPTMGALIHREPNLVVLWTGHKWQPLNPAGWTAIFAAPFPDGITIGDWAILAPVPQLGGRQPFRTPITDDDVCFAMQIIVASLKTPPVLPDYINEPMTSYRGRLEEVTTSTR